MAAQRLLKSCLMLEETNQFTLEIPQTKVPQQVVSNNWLLNQKKSQPERSLILAIPKKRRQKSVRQDEM